MEFSIYTEDQFKAGLGVNLETGSINLLISGTLGGLVSADGRYLTGSWSWNSGSRLDSASLGTLNGGQLCGIVVSNIDAFGTDNRSNFKLCERLMMTVGVGSGTQELFLDIVDKQAGANYTYFKVNANLNQSAFTDVPVFFQRSGSMYLGYESLGDGGVVTSISLSPYFRGAESDDYNPTLNNVIGDTESTFTYRVEPMYNREYLTYQDVCTTLADIPDYFFTSVANGSGRWLGSKNADTSTYAGFKEFFVEQNFNVETRKIDSNLIYRGVPQIVSGSNNIKLTGNVFGTVDARVFGNIEGPVIGTVSGFVDGISLDGTSNIEHYSGSISGSLVGTGLVVEDVQARVDISGSERTYLSGSLTGSLDAKFVSGSVGLFPITSKISVTGSGNLRVAVSGEISGSVDVTGSGIKVVAQQGGSINLAGFSGTAEAANFTGSFNFNEKGTVREINFMSGSFLDMNGSSWKTSEMYGVTVSGSIPVVGLIQDSSEEGASLGGDEIEVAVIGGGGVSIFGTNTGFKSSTGVHFSPGTLGLNISGSKELGASDFKFSKLSNGVIDLQPGTGGTFHEVACSGLCNISATGSGEGTLDLHRCSGNLNITTASLDSLVNFNLNTSMNAALTLKSGAVDLDLNFDVDRSNYRGSVISGAFSRLGLEGPWNVTERGTQEGEIVLVDSPVKVNLLCRVNTYLSASLKNFTGSYIPYGSSSSTSITTSSFEERCTLLDGTFKGGTIQSVQALQLIPMSGSSVIQEDVPTVIAYVSGCIKSISGRMVQVGDITYSGNNSTCGVSGIISGGGKLEGNISLGEWGQTVASLENTKVEFNDVRAYEGFTGSFVEGSINGGTIKSFTETGGPLTISGTFFQEERIPVKGTYEGVVKGMIIPETSETGIHIKNTGSIAGIGSSVLVYFDKASGSITGSGYTATVDGRNDASYLQGSATRINLDGEGTGSINLFGTPVQLILTGSGFTGILGENTTLIGSASLLNVSCSEAFNGSIGNFVGNIETDEAFGRLNIVQSKTVSSVGVETGNSCNMQTIQAGLDLRSETNEIGLDGQFEGRMQSISSSTDTEVSGTYIGTVDLSGSFNLTGDNFRGDISPVQISQVVSGSFDADFDGQINFQTQNTNISGAMNVQVQGDIKGVKGNVVEGKDRPFFYVQEFSGAVFTADTENEAIWNMNLSDMAFQTLMFAPGMVLVDGGSIQGCEINLDNEIIPFTKYIPRHMFVKNTLTLPGVGDIPYTDEIGKTRIVSSKIYSPDLDQILTVDKLGFIVDQIKRGTEIQ